MLFYVAAGVAIQRSRDVAIQHAPLRRFGTPAT